MKIETARKLTLEIKPDETNVVIEGYGGAMVNPIGIVKTEVEIDEIETVDKFLCSTGHVTNGRYSRR
jgi:hypothetical protein